VVGWKAYPRICRSAPSVDELELARQIVTIYLARRCVVRRGNCMLMWKTAKVGAVLVSDVHSLGFEYMPTWEYDVRCPSLCNRATS
jgi:hypothetical protein